MQDSNLHNTINSRVRMPVTPMPKVRLFSLFAEEDVLNCQTSMRTVAFLSESIPSRSDRTCSKCSRLFCTSVAETW